MVNYKETSHCKLVFTCSNVQTVWNMSKINKERHQPERRQLAWNTVSWRRSGVFRFNFEHILFLVLLFLVKFELVNVRWKFIDKWWCNIKILLKQLFLLNLASRGVWQSRCSANFKRQLIVSPSDEALCNFLASPIVAKSAILNVAEFLDAPLQTSPYTKTSPVLCENQFFF